MLKEILLKEELKARADENEKYGEESGLDIQIFSKWSRLNTYMTRSLVGRHLDILGLLRIFSRFGLLLDDRRTSIVDDSVISQLFHGELYFANSLNSDLQAVSWLKNSFCWATILSLRTDFS